MLSGGGRKPGVRDPGAGPTPGGESAEGVGVLVSEDEPVRPARRPWDRLQERLASQIARSSLPDVADHGPDEQESDEQGRPWRGNPT